MSETINMPFDVSPVDPAIARRRAMAEAMMQQAMQPMQQSTAGGYVVPLSPVQGISKMLQAIMARQELDSVDAQSAQAEQSLAKQLGAATKAYTDLRGKDPMGAFQMAMSSRLKPLMQMAMADLKSSQVSAKDISGLYEKYTPESVAAWKADKSAPLVPLPDVRTVEGQLVRTSKVTGEPLGQPTDFRPKFGPVGPDPVTGIPMQFNQATGEGKAFTGGNVTPDRAGQKELETGAAGLVLSTLKDSHTAGLAARQGLQTIANARDAIASGAKTGPFTDLKIYAGKLADSMGLKVNTAVPDEVLVSQLGEQMLSEIRKLAPVTQEDVKILQAIKGGSVTGREALEQMLTIAERSMAKAITSHNAKVEGMAEGGPAMQVLRQQLYIPVDVEGMGVTPSVGSQRVKFLGFKEQ